MATTVERMPIGNAKLELARDQDGAVIGVTIIMLVKTNDIIALPAMFREQARQLVGEAKE